MRRHNPKNNGVFLPFNDVAFSEKWAEWLQYRKERRIRAYTPTGIKRTFEKLKEDCKDDVNVAIAIINQSIALSYQGLFPLKNQNGNHGTQAPITNAGIKDAVINFVNGGK